MMIKNLIKRIFNLYDIEDLKVGANCGCCGQWMPQEIVPKVWAWSLCHDKKKCGHRTAPWVQWLTDRVPDLWAGSRRRYMDQPCDPTQALTPRTIVYNDDFGQPGD